MKAVQITKNVYWVGAIDWDLRNFHGYLTQRGSTYNAYLVVDDKITLIDTVKHYLCDEMLSRISSVIDPARIDNVICNHVEMDHSGSLPRIMQMAPHAQIITSPSGLKGLQEHYKTQWSTQVVKTGDKLTTGTYEFQFIQTPMVHWPDNMVTYLPKEKILFSNDAFGQHLATSERFDDEYQIDTIIDEARKYYANIVLPYSDQVRKALQAAAPLPIEIIAPSHGILWRRHIARILGEYTTWSNNETIKKTLVIYDTMWNSTRLLAHAIQDVFENAGYRTKMLNLQHNHISDVMTEAIDARYICVGSPTLNNNMLPTVAAFLTYFKGLAPRNRHGLAFGSYGWGGQSIDQVQEVLASCGLTMLPGIKTKYIPDDQTLQQVREQLEKALQQDQA